MTIKEVEQLTGLTAKTIRYYEKEGLLTVKRNKNNSYRNYSEEDVLLLKKIKLFRYIDFSVAQIKTLLQADDAEISNQLLAQAERLEEKGEKLQDKKVLCMALRKDMQKSTLNLSEYEDTIDFLEDEEVKDLLNELASPSLIESAALILTCLGPILWLFIYIEERQWDMLPLTSILALLAAAVITLLCQRYWDWYKNRKHALKQKEPVKDFL